MRKFLIILLIMLLPLQAFALQKNVASQKIAVYAEDVTTLLPKTGDAANITAWIWQDYISGAVVADTNPTELDATNAPGVYVFDVTQADTNGDIISLIAKSVTSNIQLKPVIIQTVPEEFSDEKLATSAQLDNIANTGAAINKVVSSGNLVVGDEGITDYTDTQALNDAEHTIDHVAGAIDSQYTFDIGSTGVPVSLTMVGRLYDPPSVADTMDVFAWDYVGSAWSQIDTIPGVNSGINLTYTGILFSNHVGTGVNAGEVQIRYEQTGLGVGTTLNIDLLYVSYSVVASPVGYANGRIWIDTVNGTAGTTPGVHGVADLPVDSWADALTLSASTGLTNFNLNQGSSITLTSAISYLNLTGLDYLLNLNGQQLDNTTIVGAVVFGTATGNGGSILFERCKFGAATLPEAAIVGSAIAGTITFNEAGTYFFDRCASAVAGTAAPVIDFGAAIGDVALNVRHYSGGLDIRNMGQVGTDTMSLEGHGQLIMNANCVGGTVALRGHFNLTNNTTGAVTLSDGVNYQSSIIQSGVAQGSGTGTNQIVLATAASSVNGAYDPAMIMIAGGTGVGQTRMIYQYHGGTRTATVDRDWKVNPDATSEYRIIAHSGREHVNEGLAQGGTTTTIILNALASSSNTAYSGQTVFLKSGTGADQSKEIVGYNGTTKIATILGEGSVIVDHDYGGADNLTYEVASVGINNAVVKAFLKSDYDAGNYGSAYVKAETTTNVSGQWVSQLNLDPAVYTIYFFKQGYYGPDTQEVTVTP